MFNLIFSQVILWQFIAQTMASSVDILAAGTDSRRIVKSNAGSAEVLTVGTDSGTIVGVEQRTFVKKLPYISFKGIPYAEPPVGNLRFKAPKPVKKWKKPLVTTNEYKSSCLSVAQSTFLNLQSKKSEDCLYLNVYTPVMERVKSDKDLAVVFFIHGGAYTEGDGTDLYQGPDFMMEENVVLVVINYRLGPFGFANFDSKGYTGNMGLKDQREALKWVKKNIKNFGGDPNSITIIGQSAGAASVHIQLLSDSCELVKRAVMLSGSSFNYWAYNEKNNHLDLIKETFKDELNVETSKEDILNFMIKAPAELIVQKSPVIDMTKRFLAFFWTPVVEDAKLAENPILTQRPHEIYKNNQFSAHCKTVEVVFGITSAEYISVVNPRNPYDFVEPLKDNWLIGLPYHGLNLAPNTWKYKYLQAKIKKFYFGNEPIEANEKLLNQYVQMCSDMNFVVPFYEVLKLHSKVSRTFCQYFDISLGTNIAKIPRKLGIINGMGHIEETGYFFKANEYVQLYEDILSSQNTEESRTTMKAWQFVTKLFADFARTGPLKESSPVISVTNPQCVHVTNTGLGAIVRPNGKSIEFWDKIRESVKSKIFNEF